MCFLEGKGILGEIFEISDTIDTSVDVCYSAALNKFYVAYASGRIVSREIINVSTGAYNEIEIIQLSDIAGFITGIHFDDIKKYLMVAHSEVDADSGLYFIDTENKKTVAHFLVADADSAPIQVQLPYSTTNNLYYLTYFEEQTEKSGYYIFGFTDTGFISLRSTFIEGQDQITQTEEDLCLTFAEIDKLIEDSTQLLLTC